MVNVVSMHVKTTSSSLSHPTVYSFQNSCSTQDSQQAFSTCHVKPLKLLISCEYITVFRWPTAKNPEDQPLAAEWHIYPSRCEVFKKLNDIYIYVATSVTKFGAILFTPIMHTVEFCFAVDSWRSGLPCEPQCPPLPPQPHRVSLLYVNTYQLRIYRSWLIPFQTQHVLFMAWNSSWERLDINIGLWNKQKLLTRKFSVVYCNAYSQTKFIHKNRRYPQKLMFTDAVGPTDVL